MKERIEEKVALWAEPIAQELGLELVDVEWVKEGGQWYLRVYIDKEQGIELDDCQNLSRKIDEMLDREDPIAHSYLMEVSSPGIERPLKKASDFERFKGETIRITTFAPIDGSKEHIGQLVTRTKEDITILVDNQEKALPVNKVSSVRLHVNF
ncbi:ribosome maturation factor RimP [Heliorestis acidaminivorans]|uniref:Ribosome maturation factor RimP n=1 Tax=Heliorestis acidaminivorans TaxID=553427 RepID=A0A6I0F087_9FIRM|nr:ribosome maturation factor RimP [Heliorestis acidaminivorans]KAB2954356.1 ribosome maturation factor RimP [Heliorestis acidaminivorans]